MANASTYLLNKLIDHATGKASYTQPTHLYLGLWTSALTATSNGGTAGEVSSTGTGYDRVQLDTHMAAAVSSSIQNNATISFPQATGSWGTVTYFGIFDGNTKTSADNLLFFGTLASQSPVSGDTLQLLSGALTVTINDSSSPSANGMSTYLENKLLDHVFRNAAFSAPAAVYVGLFLASLATGSVAPFGNNEVSTTGTNYSRTAVTYTSASGGQASNASSVVLPTVGATGWGSVVSYGIFDGNTVNAGNLLFYAPVSANPLTGETYVFNTGNLTASIA